ncbi:hypothetical protein [Bartonella gliris]|uniref:hypothetical protein n=1 Tax=Bartonella gliris TaxID=3004109 RepID=UPI00387376BE
MFLAFHGSYLGRVLLIAVGKHICLTNYVSISAVVLLALAYGLKLRTLFPRKLELTDVKIPQNVVIQTESE